jgi:putative drug exporter of the RND superfamily
MVAVFSTFATLSVISMRQLGVGLAVAIFLDATIVRGLLVPAVMSLLGERNWYLPRWLDRRLPQVTSEPQELAAAWPSPSPREGVIRVRAIARSRIAAMQIEFGPPRK